MVKVLEDLLRRAARRRKASEKQVGRLRQPQLPGLSLE